MRRKNVLLIGDSIRLGYCRYVEERLSDIANVRYPAENCRFTQYTYVGLTEWKNLFDDPEAVDAVYWNNGHWDIENWDAEPLNSPEEYARMLSRIKEKLQKYFPNARIIFATTTPMNPANPLDAGYRTTEQIISYNYIAQNTLSREGVAIDDLFLLLKNASAESYIDFCHLTDAEYERLGTHVAQVIRRCLED